MENVSFKMKHPIAFGVISDFVCSFSTNVLGFLTISVGYISIFLIRTFGKVKIYFTEDFDQFLIFSIVSILFCFLYVCLNHLVHIYKIKSLKEIVKNTYFIFLIFLILIVKRIIYFIGLHASFKTLLEMLPSFIKIFQTAFVEETIHRGILCKFIALKHGKNEKGIFLSILLSSAIFGLSHINNLRCDIPLNAVINQVIISFGHGCFLAGMYLKSGNIWETILIHFLNNAHSGLDVYFVEGGPTIKSAISEMGDFNCFYYLIESAIVLLLTYIFYLRKKKIKDLVFNVNLIKEYELEKYQRMKKI